MEDALLGNFNKRIVKNEDGQMFVRPQPIQSKRTVQRFPFADYAYYKVKSDDVPCLKNKVIPYDELYELKGVPFHSPEGVKYYVDRKRKIEKLDKQQEKSMCDKRHYNKCNRRVRDSGWGEDNVEKKKIEMYYVGELE